MLKNLENKEIDKNKIFVVFPRNGLVLSDIQTENVKNIFSG